MANNVPTIPAGPAATPTTSVVPSDPVLAYASRQVLHGANNELSQHAFHYINAPSALKAKNMAANSGAAGMLRRQLKLMQNDRDLPGISCGLIDDNVFEWETSLMIDEDCDFYGGGIFHAKLIFPGEYPLLPPKMTFKTPIFHPNVYPSGEVCISILHPPEEDKYGYESASERWSPVQTPSTILLSVISMLSSKPNDESAANLEAAKVWREDPKEFKKRCRRCVRDSLEAFGDC